MGAHVGGLDVVPLLGAIARGAMVRCHCWVPLGGCTGWRIGRCWVPWLGAMCKVPLRGCARWRVGRGALAGCHVVRCHCWVPLGGCTGGLDMVRCHCWVPLGGCRCWRIGPGAIAGCHC